MVLTFRDTLHRKRPTSREIYLVVVAVPGMLLLAAAIAALVARPPDIRWAILAGLTVASALLTLRMPSVPISLSISDIFIFSAALLFGPAAGALTAAIDAAVLSTRPLQMRRTVLRTLFNVSAAALAMGASSRLFFALVRTGPFAPNPSDVIRHAEALAIFAIAYFALNTVLVAGALAAGGQGALWRVWRDHFMPLWPGYAGGAFAAGLGLFLLSAQNGNLHVLAFVLPIPFILYISFRTSVGRMADDVTHLTQINSMYLATIETLAQAVNARDDVTHDHVRRVQKNAIRLARALNVEDAFQLRAIEAAALLHDIGKLAVPEHILNKPDKLTPTEFSVMKLHASIGADILSPVGFPFPVVPIVRHHHENWDGNGYPDGLRGVEIPVGARVLSVVDCFDALTSDRPYRRAFSAEKALEIIQERSGVMYDPSVVAALMAIKDEIVAQAESPDAASTSLTETIAQARQATRTDDSDRAVPALAVNLAGRLGQIVGRHEGLDATCQALEAEIRLRIPGLTIVLYQYDSHLDALYARTAAGVHAKAVEGLTIGLGLRLTGWVGAHRSTIVNSEAALDLGNIASQLRPVPKLCLSTPLVNHGTLSGVLTVYSTSNGQFTATDVALFEMLATLLAPRLVSGAEKGHEPSAGAALRLANPSVQRP